MFFKKNIEWFSIGLSIFALIIYFQVRLSKLKTFILAFFHALINSKEWKIWNFYANDHLLRAFELDSLKSSHPIEVNVKSANEVFQIFDSISYCKGSSIIRMIDNLIGSDLFIQGLQNYLAKFKFRNATTSDLIRELEVSSKQELKLMIESWTQQTGYPVVHVK